MRSFFCGEAKHEVYGVGTQEKEPSSRAVAALACQRQQLVNLEWLAFLSTEVAVHYVRKRRLVDSRWQTFCLHMP
jgi:hypothetical protein